MPKYEVEVVEKAHYKYTIESDEQNKLSDAQEQLDNEYPVEILDRDIEIKEIKP